MEKKEKKEAFLSFGRRREERRACKERRETLARRPQGKHCEEKWETMTSKAPLFFLYWGLRLCVHSAEITEKKVQSFVFFSSHDFPTNVEEEKSTSNLNDLPLDTRK